MEKRARLFPAYSLAGYKIVSKIRLRLRSVIIAFEPPLGATIFGAIAWTILPFLRKMVGLQCAYCAAQFDLFCVPDLSTFASNEPSHDVC